MMTMLDFEQLYKRAKWGGTVLAEGREPLSQEEVDGVAEELAKPEPQADPATLIQTLGRAGAVRYRGLVESFLTCAEDPMAARRALEVLCDDWNMTAEYAEVVRTFMEGVGWDDEGQVRSLALITAGEHLRKQRDSRLLELLLRIFVDPADDPLDRQTAYLAIARAVGRDWDELPSAARDFDLETEVDPQVIEEAERLLGR